MLRIALLLTLLSAALSTPPSAQTVPDLSFLDTFAGAYGTAIDAHAPEIGGAWTVEPAGATAPTTQQDGLVFVRDTPRPWAVAAGPAGTTRTITVGVREPVGFTILVDVSLAARFTSTTEKAGYLIQWRPGETSARVYFVVTGGGSGPGTALVGSIPYTGTGRTVQLASVQHGASYTLTADGETVATRTESRHASAPGFAVSTQASLSSNGGPLGVITEIAVTSPRTATTLCAGLSGWQAETCIREEHRPRRLYPYDTARDYLYGTIWAEQRTATQRAVTGIYGGSSATYRIDQSTPRDQVQAAGFNTEHVWPQSRGADARGARSDLHHLAPAYGSLNTARSNRPFADDFQQFYETARWLKARTSYYASDFTNGFPVSGVDEFSRVEKDYQRQPDDGDGFKSLAELGRFDVRHDTRGDVARMAAYFLVMYRVEAEDGDEGPAFIEATRDVLLRWHQADPVDAWEAERNARLLRIQGNANPFVVDATLMQRALYQGAGQPRPRNVWINEIHHSNDGTDVHEGVEIAGPAGTDLYGWRLHFYSGLGTPYSVEGPGTTSFTSLALRETINDEAGGLGAIWIALQGLRSGCNGYALADPDGDLVQFLSTGGCQFNALSGVVFDRADAVGASDPAHPDSLAWSTAIQGPPRTGPRRRVQEWNAMPVGYSVQLTGQGDSYADFAWGGPHIATRGRLNDYQAPALAPNPTTGWKAGDAVAPSLVAPATDPGHDEDASASPAPPADDAAELTVGRPFPNPASHAVRLDLALPGDAEARVYDALGRRVLTLPLVPGVQRAEIDVSSLAAGIYAVRVTTAGDSAPHHVTRRFTVAR